MSSERRLLFCIDHIFSFCGMNRHRQRNGLFGLLSNTFWFFRFCILLFSLVWRNHYAVLSSLNCISCTISVGHTSNSVRVSVDDVLVVNFYAKYTAPFTAATAFYTSHEESRLKVQCNAQAKTIFIRLHKMSIGLLVLFGCRFMLMWFIASFRFISLIFLWSPNWHFSMCE